MQTLSQLKWVSGILLLGLLVLVRSALPQSVHAAGVWYVATTGNDANDCATPATSCASINAAIANPGFVAGDTIRVAVGIYTGTGSQVVLITQAVTVSGGWDVSFTTPSGMSTIDGQGVRGGVTINGAGLVNLDRLNIQFGLGNSGGGGIFSYNSQVAISNSTIYSNTAGAFPIGGGIRSFGGSLDIFHSEIINNTADADGGISSGGALTITASLVANNIAKGGVAGGISNVGGFDPIVIRNSTISNNLGTGVYNPVYGSVAINNSTISGNIGQDGGGIYNYGGTITIKSTTITGNRATKGGGIYEPLGFAGANTNLENTILSGNTASTAGADCYGFAYSQGYNLFGNSESCYLMSALGALDILGGNPNLAPLADNGGGLVTHALLAGSVAIDAGNPAGCAGTMGVLDQDERGFPRIGRCDIGAFELQPLDYSILTVHPANIWVNGTLNYSLVIKNNTSASVPGIFITNTLPTKLDFASGSSSATGGTLGYANGVMTWHGNLNAQGVITITYNALVNQTASISDVIVNTASISQGAVTFARSASATVISPLASSTKTANKGIARLGESIAYTIQLVNQNAVDIPNVWVTDTLPVGLNYQVGSLSTINGNASFNNEVMTWNGTVPAQSQSTISFSTLVNRSTPIGTTLVNTALINNNGLVASRSASTYIAPFQVYLPTLGLHYNPPSFCTPGICGYVTFTGTPASGVPVTLRFYNGSAWSTLATTATGSDGRYAFTGVPSLNPGQGYYVRFSNATNPNQLASWATRLLDAYTAGTNVPLGNFDITNIPLVAPAPGANVYMPATFQWGARPATPTDSYEFNLLNYTNGIPWWWTDPLGYVGGYTMNKLPTGFYTVTSYGWYVGVYSPDGGYGTSYYLNGISFNTAGFLPRPSLPTRAKSKLDDLPRPKVAPTR